VVDATLHVVETQYDISGDGTTIVAYANPLASGTSDFTYDAVKAQVVATAPPFASASDRIAYTVFDTAGRVAYTVDIFGQNSDAVVTGVTYNLAGQVTKTVQYASVRTTTALPSQPP